MSYLDIDYPHDKQAFYQLLREQVAVYTDPAPTAVSALANAAAVLGAACCDINWAGFYIVSRGKLVLGPFQGKPAVQTIDLGQGVCGAAWQNRKAVIVQDVHSFPGHIACDFDSKSEIAVPVFDQDWQVLGIIDIDSPTPARFNDQDAQGLEAVASLIARHMAIELS